MPRAATLLLLIVAVLMLVLPAVHAASTSPLTVSMSVSPQSVYSGFGATAVAQVSGGNAPYTYAWKELPLPSTYTTGFPIPTTQQPDSVAAYPGSCTSTSDTCTVVGSASTKTQFGIYAVVTDSSGTTVIPAAATFTMTPYACILGTAGDLGSCIANAIPLAAIGILLSIALVAIAFMLGETLKIEGLQGWYKSELWETTKSVLLIGIAIGLIVILSGIASSFATVAMSSQGTSVSQVSPCLSSSALSQNLCTMYQSVYSGYLDPQLKASYTSFAALYGLAIGVGAIKSVEVHTYLPIPVLPPPLPTVMFVRFGSEFEVLHSNFLEPNAESANASFLMDLIAFVATPMILLFQFLYDLLPTIIILGIVVFVPLGIILRAIPFLRPIGGTLFAIGITLSIIFPALLLLLNMPVTNYFGYVTASQTQAVAGGCSGFFGCIWHHAADALASVLAGSGVALDMLGAIIGHSNAYGNTAPFINGVSIGLYHSVNGIMPAFNFAVSNTFGLLLQFLLLILDVVICMTIANAIAKPLGGSVKFGIGKFKLA